MFKLSPEREGIVTPREHALDELRTTLAPLLVGSGEETGWLELFQLYRNKLTHLGYYLFSQMRLHDAAGTFYGFLPNRWPYTVHQQLQEKRAEDPDAQPTTAELLQNTLVHQDIVQYSEALLRRIMKVLDGGFGVLLDIHRAMKNSELNQKALEAIESNTRQYEFRAFES